MQKVRTVTAWLKCILQEFGTLSIIRSSATAGIACRAWSMRNGTVSVRSSVCLSVCPSTGGAVGPAGRRYRSIAAAAAGECGQCHVVSVRRPLNTQTCSYTECREVEFERSRGQA